RCRASIRTLNGPLLGPVHFGVRSKPRSVTVVMNLGLLGLPSKSRSHGPAFKTQSPEQGDGCRYLPNLLDSLPSLTNRWESSSHFGVFPFLLAGYAGIGSTLEFFVQSLDRI